MALGWLIVPSLLDKGIIKEIREIQQLDTENKSHLFALMDEFLRDSRLSRRMAHKIYKSYSKKKARPSGRAC